MSKLLAAFVAIEGIAFTWLCMLVFGPQDGIDANVAIRPPAAAVDRALAAPAIGKATPSAPTADRQEPAAPVVREATRAKYRPDDLLGVMLTGTVRWRDGAPVGGANLWAARDKTNVSGESGPDGTFAVLRFTPGEWQLTVRAEGAVENKQPLVVSAARASRP